MSGNASKRLLAAVKKMTREYKALFRKPRTAEEKKEALIREMSNTLSGLEGSELELRFELLRAPEQVRSDMKPVLAKMVLKRKAIRQAIRAFEKA